MMSKKPKHNIVFLTSIVLFTIYLLSTLVMSGILARYSTFAFDSTSAQVAQFNIDLDVLDVNNQQTQTSILGTVQYVYVPGKETKININVDGSDNEVKVKCKITFEKMGELPLKIMYNGNEISEEGIEFELNPSVSKLLENIIVVWDSNETDYKYNGKIGLVTVSVTVEQIS